MLKGLKFFLLFLFFEVVWSTNHLLSQPNITKLMNEGKAFRDNKLYEQAIEKYSKVISLANKKGWDYYYAHFLRAQSYYTLGKYEESIQDYNVYIDIKPDAVSYHNRAMCYYSLNRYEQAYKDFTRSIDKVKKPKMIESDKLTYYYRGRTSRELNRHADAIEDYTKAISLSTDIHFNAEAYVWRAGSKAILGKLSEATEDYKPYLILYPENIGILFWQGRCYKYMGNLVQAKENARKLLELIPSGQKYFSGDSLLNLFDFEKRNATARQKYDVAQVTMNGEKFAEAFDQFEEAYGYYSNMTSEGKILGDKIINSLCLAYSKLKNKPPISELTRKYLIQADAAVSDNKTDQAIGYFEKALDVSPYNPRANFNLALLHAQKKNYQDAIVYMKRYLLLVPDADDARAAQDKIYEWESKIK